MGTWGLGTFEDDVACDWIEDLYDSDPTAFFVECLDLSGTDSLRFIACVGVVCTAEVIHGLICGPRDGLPESIHVWLQEHHGLNCFPLLPDAIEGLRRVTGSESEMRALWEDQHEHYADWLQHVGDLQRHLEVAFLRSV